LSYRFETFFIFVNDVVQQPESGHCTWRPVKLPVSACTDRGFVYLPVVRADFLPDLTDVAEDGRKKCRRNWYSDFNSRRKPMK
jgi:hypothetical protein